jgi:transposase InsO family protein
MLIGVSSCEYHLSRNSLGRYTRAEAKAVIETWRQGYNRERPHSSLGYLTPRELIEQLPEAASERAIFN